MFVREIKLIATPFLSCLCASNLYIYMILIFYDIIARYVTHLTPTSFSLNPLIFATRTQKKMSIKFKWMMEQKRRTNEKLTNQKGKQKMKLKRKISNERIRFSLIISSMSLPYRSYGVIFIYDKYLLNTCDELKNSIEA